MDNDKKWSVYIHTCLINQKSYVGITSKKPEYRWGSNGDGYKRQSFYNAIQKYGWDNFEHKIVASNLSEKEAKEMEIYLIDKLQSHIHKNGYNVTLGGDGYLGVDNNGANNPMYGKHHSEETKKKISEKNKGKTSSMLGKHHSEETKKKMSSHQRVSIIGENNYWYNKKNENMIKAAVEANSKSVCQFNLDMELIQIYKSITQASKNTGVNYTSISQCCKYKTKTAGGFIWLYESELNRLSELKLLLIDNLINKNSVILGKSVYQFDKSLNLINKFISIREASKKTNVVRTDIAKACNGELKTAGGYVWKFEYDIKDIDYFKNNYNINFNKSGKRVAQYDMDNNFICEYISCAEASRILNIPRTSISKTCRGEQRSAGGYIWKYV